MDISVARPRGFFCLPDVILPDMSTPLAVANIAANLARLHDRIATAAARAGRSAESVHVVAVSKYQPAAAVAAAVAAGQRRFGENTVQEALSKIPHFAEQGLEWHFIGHLQANKAKHIPGNFTWLHSLDSLRLAERVARFAEDAQTIVNALIEVNVTRDPHRHGVLPEQVPALLDQIVAAGLSGLVLRGLMAIGPHPASDMEIRTAFAAVRNLREACVARHALPAFTELSMGMSDDYEPAILEGSTLVRVGTAIFGERPYPVA
jgi:pyridoxal phosphate enzyme (YggS family)